MSDVIVVLNYATIIGVTSLIVGLVYVMEHLGWPLLNPPNIITRDKIDVTVD